MWEETYSILFDNIKSFHFAAAYCNKKDFHYSHFRRVETEYEFYILYLYEKLDYLVLAHFLVEQDLPFVFFLHKKVRSMQWIYRENIYGINVTINH